MTRSTLWPVMGWLLLTLLNVPCASAHGDLELRISAITRQIAAATNNPASLYLQRAELHREHQNWPAAAADYEQAAKSDPTLPDLDLCRAKMLTESGKLNDALTLLHKLIGKSPTNGAALVLSAQVYARQGDLAKSIAAYRSGLEEISNPEPNLFLELARIEVSEGKTNDALKSVEWGLRKSGPDLSLHSYALELEMQSDAREASLNRLNTIIDLATRKEGWLVQRGELLLKMGRTEEGRQSMDAALQEIHKLPPRLQKTPSMLKLQTQISAALNQSPEVPPQTP